MSLSGLERMLIGVIIVLVIVYKFRDVGNEVVMGTVLIDFLKI